MIVEELALSFAKISNFRALSSKLLRSTACLECLDINYLFA